MKKTQTQILTNSWLELLKLFRRIEFMTNEQIISELNQINLETELKQALHLAIKGDNHQINNWLFSRPLCYTKPLPWLAPVLVDKKSSYIWMIGFQNPSSSVVHKKFASVRDRTKNDSLLQQTLLSPPLLFVDPVEISNVNLKHRKSKDGDEFAIFQTKYKRRNNEFNDLEQRMILNASFLQQTRIRFVQRARSVSAPNNIFQQISDNAMLFSILHTEGHNQGHFTGYWPLDATKTSVIYEIVEEYKSCVASIQLASYIDLTPEQLDAFAVSIFISRFFGFGFDAYCLETQRRETVREISVGMMFFHLLLSNKAISLNSKNNYVQIELNASAVRKTLLNSLVKINNEERLAKQSGKEALKEIAKWWYNLAFPGGSYSYESLSIYQQLANLEEKNG